MSRNKRRLQIIKNVSWQILDISPHFYLAKNVARYDVGDNNLMDLLTKSADNKIDYVAIRGEVKALDQSIRSNADPIITGVISQCTVIEHRAVKQKHFIYKRQCHQRCYDPFEEIFFEGEMHRCKRGKRGYW